MMYSMHYFLKSLSIIYYNSVKDHFTVYILFFRKGYLQMARKSSTKKNSKGKVKSDVQNTLIDVRKSKLILDKYDTSIVDERTGKIVDKNDIKHLLLIYDNHGDEYMRGYTKPKESDEKPYNTLSDEEFQKRIDDDLVMSEMLDISDIDDNDYDEISKFDKEDDGNDVAEIYKVIKQELKISINNNYLLDKKGWYIVPIFEGMTEFRPIWWEKVSEKIYGTKIMDEPLFTIDRPIYRYDNEESWKFNSIPLLIKALRGTPNYYRFIPKTILQHVRYDKGTLELKMAMKNFENVQRMKIKVHNQVNSYYSISQGLPAFDAMKKQIAESEGADKKDIVLVEYMVKEVERIIEKMSEEYSSQKTLLKEIDKFHKKYPNENLSKNEEFVQMMSKYTNKCLKQDFGYIRSEKEFIKYTEGMDLAFIESYSIYEQVRAYIKLCRDEDQAEKRLSEYVNKHIVWKRYLSTIEGCGPRLAGYLLAYLNPLVAPHASSFVRYCGLDQIIVIPDIESKGIDDERRRDTIAFLVHQYWYTQRLAEVRDIDLNIKTFRLVAPDGLKKWSDYQEIGNLVKRFGLTKDEYLKGTSKIQDIVKAKFTEIMELYGYLINKCCTQFDVEYYNGRYSYEEVDPNNKTISHIRIKKRARKKGVDNVRTSHISKTGDLSLKDGCGFNCILKSKIMEVLTSSILRLGKKKNTEWQQLWYYINAEEYRKVEAMVGKNPDTGEQLPVNGNYVKTRTNRKFAQLFLQYLWMAEREIYGYPLNGGFYMNERFVRYHNIVHPTILPEESCFEESQVG